MYLPEAIPPYAPSYAMNMHKMGFRNPVVTTVNYLYKRMGL